MSQTGRGKTLSNALVILVGWTALALVTWRAWAILYAGQMLRYADDGRPMITAVDGFYYLQAAFAHLASGQAAPALSRLAALLHQWSGVALTDVALWLPVGISAAMPLVYLLWGRVLEFSASRTALAAFAGLLIPAWVERSALGWFDTDPGIALLWNICLACAALLAAPERRFSLWAASGMLASGVLLAAWWRPGAVLLPTAIGLWGLSFVWAPDTREKRLRQGVLAALVLAGAAFWFVPESLGPQAASLRRFAVDHLLLVSGAKGDLVTLGIDELHARPWADSLADLGGTPWSGGLLLALSALLFVRRFRAAWFLLPSAAALCAGFWAPRFLYLGAVPLGLGLAFLSAPRFRLSARLCCLALTGAVLASQLFWLSTWVPEHSFTQTHDAAAVALRRAAGPGAVVWAWWDDGYFLKSRTGLSVLFDGGSQEPLRAYVAARPFVTGDERFARRWMRFFALRGHDAAGSLIRAWGGEARGWRELESVFSADDPRAAVAALPSVPGVPGGTYAWLFPQGQVFLYLPQRLFRISSVWSSIGLYRNPTPEQAKPCVQSFERGVFSYDPASNTATLPDEVRKKYALFNGVYDTDRKPLVPPWPARGIFAVASAQSSRLYVANPVGLRSLPLRLMAPGGVELAGFRKIAAYYDCAGVWEVLP